MAKTHRNLWHSLVSWENLLLAYRKCRRRKRYRPYAVEFDFAWEANLLQLQRELIEGSYQPGEYRHFYIHEPKKRKISAAPFRDRVVHHAIVNILEPIYERRFIHDSYACRKGKGTHRAIKRAHGFQKRYHYYLKTDIVRFFPNVDHAVLLNLISRTVKDQHVTELIGRIIASGAGILESDACSAFFPGDNLFDLLRPRGLPIGNLTSQFFANVLLDSVDHFIKEELRVPGYVRYADDLVLFSNTKQQLWEAAAGIEHSLEQKRLRPHVNKTQLHPQRTPLNFLGFAVSLSGTRLQQSGITRFNRRIRRLRWEYGRGTVHHSEIAASLQAWLAHTQYANSEGIRRVLWPRVHFVRPRILNQSVSS